MEFNGASVPGAGEMLLRAFDHGGKSRYSIRKSDNLSIGIYADGNTGNKQSRTARGGGDPGSASETFRDQGRVLCGGRRTRRWNPDSASRGHPL